MVFTILHVHRNQFIFDLTFFLYTNSVTVCLVELIESKRNRHKCFFVANKPSDAAFALRSNACFSAVL